MFNITIQTKEQNEMRGLMTRIKENLSYENTSWLYRLMISTGVSALIAMAGYEAVKIHNIDLRITKVEDSVAKITPGHTTDYMELMQLRIEKSTREWVNGKFDLLNTNLWEIRENISELKNQMERHVLLTSKPDK